MDVGLCLPSKPVLQTQPLTGSHLSAPSVQPQSLVQFAPHFPPEHSVREDKQLNYSLNTTLRKTQDDSDDMQETTT